MVSRTPTNARAAGLALLVSGLLLWAAACGGGGESAGGEESATGGTTTISGAAANVHGTTNVAGKDEVEMELDDFYFGPTILEGTPGQQLKIELENEGNTEHNFSIDEQSIDQDVETSEKAEVSVTFPQSGVLQFYCSYHKQRGMVGGLKAST